MKYLDEDDSKVTYKDVEPSTTKVKHMAFSKARRDLNLKP